MILASLSFDAGDALGLSAVPSCPLGQERHGCIVEASNRP